MLNTAAYGYRYVDKYMGGGQASLEIIEEEAKVVHQMFEWIGKERLTINEVTKRLNNNHIKTKKNKSYWDRGSLSRMLKNPVYKGQAAFGKSKKQSSCQL